MGPGPLAETGLEEAKAMFGLLFALVLIGGILVLPLLVIGGLLRLVFHVAIFPFQLLGAILGLGIAGLVLGVVALVVGLVMGAIGLVGAIFFAPPILLAVLVVWALIRLLRGNQRTRQTA